MDLYTIIKIGILIFGLVSWLLYRGDRSINKEILDDHLIEREPIRDLTDEELELLQPFLTSKWAVYPYKFQSSLVDNKVSYLRGACSRQSLYSNTNEIAYYYEVDNIELFFPYNMDKHIDEFNIIEVVFTKRYGIVVKINGQDIKTALENYDPNEEYELRDFKDSKDKADDDKLSEKYYKSPDDSFDFESLTLYDDKDVDKHPNANSDEMDNLKSTNADDVNPEVSINNCKTLYEREETRFEAEIRSEGNNGLLTSLCLILATVFFIRSWFGENEQISILILICLCASVLFVWYKPKRYSNLQQVKVIEAKIHDKNTISSTVEVDEFMNLEYPKYWLNFIPETSDTITEMVIGDNDKKLLRYGHTLSINNEVEQFGPPKFVKRNKILFIIGIILSSVLYYFTDPINNSYFVYRYYSQQSKNLQINDFTTLKNSQIKQGDIVNIRIKNTSCDVNDLNKDYKCHNFFINSEKMVVEGNNVLSIERSLKHIFDPKFVSIVIDFEMMRFEDMQREYLQILNKNQKGAFYVKKSFTKIENIGQMVIDIENVCKILPIKECENVKYYLADLFNLGNINKNITWNNLLTNSVNNPNLSEIVETSRKYNLEQALEPFRSELKKQLEHIVSQYQSDDGVKVTLTNKSYIDIASLAMGDTIRFDEYGRINYYFDILTNNISPNISIIGSVSDIHYHVDQNSNIKSIAGLNVNANHHYNLGENQKISYISLIIVNIIMFIALAFTTIINGVKLIKNTRFNQHRINEIKKYYEIRLGNIINLE